MTGLLERGRRPRGAGCSSPPSPRTPRGSRPSAASRTRPGGRVCVAGRSLDRILRVAQATGYLQDFPEPIRFDEAMRLPREEVLIIATGGQGEPRAALGRIAFGNHELKLTAGRHGHLLVEDHSRQRDGDRPDHERAERSRRASIVTERQAHVHVSGHPGRPELAEMYGWIRPQIVVPVHGEARHMAEQARFALSQGVPTAIVPEERRRHPPRAGRAEEARPRSASAGWCSTATSSCRPTARPMNERRKVAVNGLIAVACRVDAERPARRRRWSCGRSACRSSRTATTSSPTPPTPPRARSAMAWTTRRCARRSGSRCAAARPCGPARSRSSR